MWISLSLDHFFDFSSVPMNATIRNIHVKCSKLFEALSLVVAPLHILYKVTTELHKQTSINQFTGDFFEEWNEITPQIHIRKFEKLTA